MSFKEFVEGELTTNVPQIFGWKCKAQRKVWSPRRKREDKNKTILIQIKYEVMNCIHLPQGVVQWCDLDSKVINL
jgi:hypothetical protein